MLGMEECWKICRFSDFENIYTTLTQAVRTLNITLYCYNYIKYLFV